MGWLDKLKERKDTLFYVTYAIWFSTSLFWGRSTLGSFFGADPAFLLKKVCYPVCAVLLLLVFCLGRNFRLRQMLLAGLLVFAFGIGYVMSGSGTFFMQMIFIIAAEGVDLKKMPHVTLGIQCIVIPLIIVLALTGVMENITVFYNRRVGAAAFRQALGFKHPNALGAQTVQLCICWLWLRWEKWKWHDYVSFFALAYFTYKVSNSYTSVVIILLIAFMAYLYKQLLKTSHAGILEKGICACVAFIPMVSLLISYLYVGTNKAMVFFDRVISLRFSRANEFLLSHNLSLFGQWIPEEIGTDNTYANFVVKFGVVILALIVWGMFRLAQYAIRRHMQPLLISIFIYMVYGLTEGYSFQMVFNFTLIYLVYAIWEDGRAEARR